MMNTTKKLMTLLLALLGLSQAFAQEDEYLPIVREGVKWVYEKVIVNQGDTSHYYYNYEFSGNDPETTLNGVIFKACYYFTEGALDIERDSLIAGLRNDIKGDRQKVTFLRNNAYHKYYDEGKLMLPFGLYTYLDGGTTWLYTFGDWGCDEFYLNMEATVAENGDAAAAAGFEVFLNEDNFYKTEPINIEGIECERYVYIDEQGKPLAYVVEGIGFDSYDLGDLLTPFVRKSGPNADYQEWCGLSHVIKDGQIIYKGMRYRPIVPGDVDGDGEITLSDANSVTDIVVMGGNTGHNHTPAADVNGDGEITIADVNAIINMILSNH
ncbi:MAG: dockerin type I repeat-containing protein [Muribaculaceae bacterium]|nr:dockerin type I repeat-containing protein [Muribaculaceae bacterium]